MFMGGIWFEDAIPVPTYFQITATLFIVGLASFLIWFSQMLMAIRKNVEHPREQN